MFFIRTLILNPSQNRLRLIWRLGVFSLLLVFLVLPAQFAVILLTAFALPLSGPVLSGILATLGAGAAITAAVFLASRFLDKRPFKTLGFDLSPAWWSDFLFGLGLGAFLMGLIFLAELGLGWIVLSPHPSLPLSRFLPNLLAAVTLYTCVGFYEELLTRGYTLKNLAEGFSSALSPRLAVSLAALLTSTLFGFLHAANPHTNPFALANIVLAGFVLAAGYLFTGQLALPIGFHISWNLVQGPILGFPVSGTSTLSGLFFQTSQAGPTIWTGGAFGPEGGLLGALALSLGLALILFYTKNRGGLQLGIAAYQARTPKTRD